jgi:polysaccharide biosynthesis/export protein
LRKYPILFTLVFLFGVGFFYSCVPIKKQIFLRDITKKNLKEIRKTDTTLAYPSYKYLLQPKDIISIKLTNVTKGEFDLSQLSEQGNNLVSSGVTGGSGYIVSDSGYVFIPLMGKIKVADLTIEEAQQKIQLITNHFFDNTIVNIKMLNFYVYLLGESTFKGKVNANSDRLTLVELMAITGGVAEYGDYRNIRIIRNIDNKAHIYYVNLLNQDLITQNSIYLKPNDVIYIEPLRAKTFKSYTFPNITLGITSVSFILALYLSIHSLLKQ